MMASSIEDLIGNTPIMKIRSLSSPDGAGIYAKLEWFNVGGSIKDRMVLYLLNFYEKAGMLSKSKTIIEATSGNTGIALSMIASVKGYGVKIVMPESVSIERRGLIGAYGAELILSPADKGTGGAIELKKRIIQESPDDYFDFNQFESMLNVTAHYETTGKEILEQMEGDLDAVVIGIGTAGTGVGISKRMKEFNPKIKIIGVMPKVGVSIQGLRNVNMENSTRLFDKNMFDEIVEIDKSEIPKVYGTARKMARTEGLLIGMSSAAAVYVSIKKSKEMGKGKKIVVIFPDSGSKYLSTGMFE
jgi:cysteine synthase